MHLVNCVFLGFSQDLFAVLPPHQLADGDIGTPTKRPREDMPDSPDQPKLKQPRLDLLTIEQRQLLATVGKGTRGSPHGHCDDASPVSLPAQALAALRRIV